MTTIAIDSNIYRGSERYAKRHNVSVRYVIESGLKQLLDTEVENSVGDFDSAISFVRTLSLCGEKPVPAEANGSFHHQKFGIKV